LCTNALLLERYAAELSRSGASCITVSIDGATARTHEKIRGVADSYEKIEKGILSLLTHPLQERPVVRVRMTICRQNVEEVGSFYRKWRRVADDVLLQPVHRCRKAFYLGEDEELFHFDPKLLVRQLEGTPLQKKDGYMDKFLLSLRDWGTFPTHRCYAGVLMVRLDPWGNVYPCLEQHACVGSVKRDNFSKIWHADVFNNVRKSISRDGNCTCWYNNTALISHYAALLGRMSARRMVQRARKVFEAQSLHRVAPSDNQ